MMQKSRTTAAAVLAIIGATACSRSSEKPAEANARPTEGTVYIVRDTTVRATLDASGIAGPMRQSTLSTRLMGTVTAVLVQEGDFVEAGQPLVRIDARDLAAKQSQLSASISEAEAVHREAELQAQRIRALYGDSAATRAQLDVAEMGLARAAAGLRTAHAGAAEVSAVASYSTIRAPFSGTVTKRFIDPGAFATPGTPLVSVQDGRSLRISVSTTPDRARLLRRGQHIDASIEGVPVSATVEGIVPVGGNLYTVNALVTNDRGDHLPGSAATLFIPLGDRSTLVVPASALVREGDLTGVTVRTSSGDEIRWIQVGRVSKGVAEVNAGLRSGDRVVIPAAASATLRT